MGLICISVRRLNKIFLQIMHGAEEEEVGGEFLSDANSDASNASRLHATLNENNPSTGPMMLILLLLSDYKI